MAAFRGVQKPAVVNSLLQAVSLLRLENIGPQTRALLDDWARRLQEGTGGFGQIADDYAFANFMRNTGTISLLHNFRDAFALYAALEAADDMETTVARDLYRDLMAWSAFFDKPRESRRDLDIEINTHITQILLARIVSNDPAERCDLAEHLTMMIGGDDDVSPETIDAMLEVMPVALDLKAYGEIEALETLMQSRSLEENRFLRHILYDASELYLSDITFQVPEALERYSCRLGLKEDPATVRREQKLCRLLNDFNRTAQAADYKRYDRNGQIFAGFAVTRQAIQSIADAMPDEVFYDRIGRQVQPRRRPPGPSP